MASFAKNKHLPVFVVHIPSREQLIRKEPLSDEQLNQFAALLNASVIDGSLAFDGLTKQEIREHFLPYDGHWAQSGSDRFAVFMLGILEKELQLPKKRTH